MSARKSTLISCFILFVTVLLLFVTPCVQSKPLRGPRVRSEAVNPNVNIDNLEAEHEIQKELKKRGVENIKLQRRKQFQEEGNGGGDEEKKKKEEEAQLHQQRDKRGGKQPKKTIPERASPPIQGTEFEVSEESFASVHVVKELENDPLLKNKGNTRPDDIYPLGEWNTSYNASLLEKGYYEKVSAAFSTTGCTIPRVNLRELFEKQQKDDKEEEEEEAPPCGDVGASTAGKCAIPGQNNKKQQEKKKKNSKKKFSSLKDFVQNYADTAFLSKHWNPNYPLILTGDILNNNEKLANDLIATKKKFASLFPDDLVVSIGGTNQDSVVYKRHVSFRRFLKEMMFEHSSDASGPNEAPFCTCDPLDMEKYFGNLAASKVLIERKKKNKKVVKKEDDDDDDGETRGGKAVDAEQQVEDVELTVPHEGSEFSPLLNHFNYPFEFMFARFASATIGLGGAGAGQPFLDPGRQFFVTLQGKQRFFMIPGEAGTLTNLPRDPTPVSWLDNEKYDPTSFAYQKRDAILECITQPGDIVFVPNYMRVSFVNLGEAVHATIFQMEH